jgi:hypothetical protein
MYTDLICPNCSELAPRVEREIRLDDTLPSADKYFCQSCDTAWHLIMVMSVTPIIFNIDEIDVCIVTWVRDEINRRREEERI